MILLAYKLTFSWPELVKTVLITFLSKFMRHVQGLKDNEWKKLDSQNLHTELCRYFQKDSFKETDND